MYFFRRELFGDDSHLLEDVVLPQALGECRKLLFNVVGLLPLQCRRSELVAAGTMAGRAGRYLARRNIEAGLALPGIDAADDYNDFAFALPGSASYLPRKMALAKERLGEAANVWEAK